MVGAKRAEVNDDVLDEEMAANLLAERRVACRPTPSRNTEEAVMVNDIYVLQQSTRVGLWIS